MSESGRLLASARGLVLCKLLRQPPPGSLALLFTAVYASLRFGLEFLRADPRGAYVAGLSPPQITCLGMVLVAVIAAGLRRRAAHGRASR